MSGYFGGGGGGAAGGITVGTSIITGGTNTRVLFDDVGVVGESAGLTYVKGTGTLTATALVGGNVTDSALTAGRVVIVGTAGLLASDAGLTYSVANQSLTIPTGTNSFPGLAVGAIDTGIYARAANFFTITASGAGQAEFFAGAFRTIASNYIGWASGAITTGTDTALKRLAATVVGVSDGSAATGWIQNSGGSSRVNADVTNATTTFAAITGLTATLLAGRKYFGRVVIKCNDSIAADGVKFDFNGGAATMTSFWAVGTELAGGTTVLGTVISTSLAGVINWTTITGETLITLDFSLVCNAAGTFIPRQAQNAHTTGTLTVELGSFMWMEDCP